MFSLKDTSRRLHTLSTRSILRQTSQRQTPGPAEVLPGFWAAPSDEKLASTSVSGNLQISECVCEQQQQFTENQQPQGWRFKSHHSSVSPPELPLLSCMPELIIVYKLSLYVSCVSMLVNTFLKTHLRLSCSSLHPRLLNGNHFTAAPLNLSVLRVWHASVKPPGYGVKSLSTLKSQTLTSSVREAEWWEIQCSTCWIRCRDKTRDQKHQRVENPSGFY